MGTYKVPQNVEAEDKLIGPFTAKQFIFLVISIALMGFTWLLFQAFAPLALLTLPFALLFMILGLYRREDQPIEVYAFAFINYILNPRKRVWHREGQVEWVHITAPKKEPVLPPKDPREVRGELNKLAQIIDTRGWSAKDPSVQEPTQYQGIDMSGRIAIQETTPPPPKEISDTDDDVMNEFNETNQRMSDLAAQAAEEARKAAMEKMKAMAKQQAAARDPGQLNRGDKEYYAEFDTNPYPSFQQHILDPQTGELTAPEGSLGSMTPQQAAAILKLAHSDELTVSQIANQAQKQEQKLLKEVQANGAA